MQIPSGTNPDPVRAQLIEFLRGGSAHVDPKTALTSVPTHHYGSRPNGSPYSPWQLLEHLRFTLHDLLDFCTNADYTAPDWPNDYWPVGEAPSDPQAWSAASESLLQDLAQFEALVEDPEITLEAEIPWGDGQTILREVLLAIDHTSYHLGQLVLLRKQLGDWQS